MWGISLTKHLHVSVGDYLTIPHTLYQLYLKSKSCCIGRHVELFSKNFLHKRNCQPIIGVKWVSVAYDWQKCERGERKSTVFISPPPLDCNESLFRLSNRRVGKNSYISYSVVNCIIQNEQNFSSSLSFWPITTFRRV